jgi:hypothetical protein
MYNLIFEAALRLLNVYKHFVIVVEPQERTVLITSVEET